MEKVLIANRSEIALRVIRACREMKIPTVAIYPEVDRKDLHVRYADEAYQLEGESPLQCYLDGAQIVEIAQKAGCDSIHPGYGFLSENAEFARQVEEGGLLFLGPRSESIALMGDKVKARQKMKEAGVPIIPGTIDPVSKEELDSVARETGFPLMLKAQGGGGGKGIRIVRSESELLQAFERASSEAKTSFGNPSLYVEKLIEEPHHVEVQILGDGKGRCISVGERDCTLQRRHQKMVEEAPCVFISPETRKDLHEKAARAGEAVHYRGAGTVEFLVDKEENFYFLEMNTRLQVEHPVTEFVYGEDLVKAQLQIGSGDYDFSRELTPRGHAIEIRIIAEDPYANFIPSTGTIKSLHLPGGPGVRLDTALYKGQEVTPHFDSMLAKLIVYGNTREEARERTCHALSEFEIQGVSTNISYVLTLLEREEFQSGSYHTRSLEEDFAPIVPQEGRKIAALASALARFMEDEEVLEVEEDHQGTGMNPWKFYGRVETLRRRR